MTNAAPGPVWRGKVSRGLANLSEQSGKLAVLADRAERVGIVEAERPFGKGSTRDAASFFRRRGRVFRMERH